MFLIKKNVCYRYYSLKHQKKKDLLLLATKLIEKITDATNTKQQYQTFLKKKNKKLVKQSKIIYSTINNFRKPKRWLL